MAIDLSKLTFPEEEFHYTHKCEKCGEEIVYVENRSGKKHYPDFGSCYGTLTVISKIQVK
jgi:hypothetical protein